MHDTMYYYMFEVIFNATILAQQVIMLASIICLMTLKLTHSECQVVQFGFFIILF